MFSSPVPPASSDRPSFKSYSARGHRVIGLARSDASARSLAGVGAEVQGWSLEELGSLQSGAAAADAVIHTAFIHDFSKFAEKVKTDQRCSRGLAL